MVWHDVTAYTHCHRRDRVTSSWHSGINRTARLVFIPIFEDRVHHSPLLTHSSPPAQLSIFFREKVHRVVRHIVSSRRVHRGHAWSSHPIQLSLGHPQPSRPSSENNAFPLFCPAPIPCHGNCRISPISLPTSLSFLLPTSLSVVTALAMAPRKSIQEAFERALSREAQSGTKRSSTMK